MSNNKYKERRKPQSVEVDLIGTVTQPIVRVGKVLRDFIRDKKL